MKTGQVLLLSALTLGIVTPALAQVTYRQDRANAYRAPDSQLYGSDEDMSYATHPSFQIFDTPYGPGVRVIERCAFPNGWNITDFSRDLNGIPPGIDHTCPNSQAAGRGVRARY